MNKLAGFFFPKHREYFWRMIPKPPPAPRDIEVGISDGLNKQHPFIHWWYYCKETEYGNQHK
jgi:hypothetical protein